MPCRGDTSKRKSRALTDQSIGTDGVAALDRTRLGRNHSASSYVSTRRDRDPKGGNSMTEIPNRVALVAATSVALAAILTGCGGGSNKPTTSTSSGSSSANPATKFSVASVSGKGNVVVDGKGRTVYVLTSGDRKNVPCTDASGCTKLWPDLPLPNGT